MGISGKTMWKKSFHLFSTTFFNNRASKIRALYAEVLLSSVAVCRINDVYICIW